MTKFTPTFQGANSPCEGEYHFVIDEATGKVMVHFSLKAKIVEPEIIDAELEKDNPQLED